MSEDEWIKQAREIFREEAPLLDAAELREYVKRFLEKRDVFLSAARRFGSPLYLFDQDTIRSRSAEFRGSFTSAVPSLECFYALKSNSHPVMIQTLSGEGFGMDVSSGWELEAALKENVQKIIFSGPGKTPDELRLACAHADRVTVLIDSFGELDRLREEVRRAGVKISAGVRLTVEDRGLWRKFGIPLDRLESFLVNAEEGGGICLRGLQFHTSWNMDAAQHKRFLARLGKCLRNIPERFFGQLTFLDIGGGFWPKEGEWLLEASTPAGRLRTCLDPDTLPGKDHRSYAAADLKAVARDIREALDRELPAAWKPVIYVEPGRWISHPSMHILLQVVDRKENDLVIVDGGTNIAGWERYEHDYCPVINLTRPSTDEKDALVFGSLCTPHDIWGFHYFGEDILPGDILLVPDQGAYTYSLRQRFIKPLPRTAVLENGTVVSC